MKRLKIYSYLLNTYTIFQIDSDGERKLLGSVFKINDYFLALGQNDTITLSFLEAVRFVVHGFLRRNGDTK